MGVLGKILLGPELYWLVVYGGVYVLAARNTPPTPGGNALLESMWWVLPLFAIPLSYGLLGLHGPGKGWMLLRINIAALVGLNFALVRAIEGVDYQDTRNSGLAAVWVLGFCFMLVVLFVADAIAAGVLVWSSRKGA